MEENTVSMVQWRLEVSPSDKDVQGVDVVSAALYLTYTGTNTARDYKVIVTLSIQVKIFSSYIQYFCNIADTVCQDVHGTELHVHSSCVYYLTREGPPDGASPSYKADM